MFASKILHAGSLGALSTLNSDRTDGHNRRRISVTNSAQWHVPVHRLVELMLNQAYLTIDEDDHLVKCQSCKEVLVQETLRAMTECDGGGGAGK